MNPVKALHSKFYDSAKLRSEIDYSMARFRITLLLEALHSLPSCYVVDHANRPSGCTCMKDPGLTAEVIHEAADFLRKFAMLKKDQQQTMIVEWVKYAGHSKVSLVGESRERQRRIWLLPDTSFLICINALKRCIGDGNKAWRSCEQMAKGNINPTGRHGLTGRTGKESNRANKEFYAMMDSFFVDIETLCTPRATRLVRDIAGTAELRDQEDELVELPAYMTKSGLYKKCFVGERAGYRLVHDAKHQLTGQFAIPGKEQKAFPGETSFVNYWNENFAYIISQKVREDICGDCYTFSNSHRFITGVLAREEKDKHEQRRQEMEGGEEDPGNQTELRERAAATLEVSELEQRKFVDKQEKLVMDAAHHVEMAKTQRDYFRDKKEEAYLDRQTGKQPMNERCVTWVADYAQNVTVPNFAGEQPGDTYYYSPCNAFAVFGFADCTIRPTPLTAHVGALEDLGKKGGNNIASMLWTQLERKGLVPTEEEQ